MKRFWTKAQAAASGGEFHILLDGRQVKMPDGTALCIAAAGLAEAIAQEWDAAAPDYTQDDLPLTRLAITARARVRFARDGIIRLLAGYGLNDLLCYRAANEPGLAAREAELWQPWIAWANQRYGIGLQCGSSVTPIAQPPGTAEAFTACLEAMDDDQLAGLGVLVPALGSLVLALAVQAGALTPQAAADCAQLEEIWQEERWGSDREALARREGIVRDIAESARFMNLGRT